MNDRVSFKPPIPYLEREEESDIEVLRGRKLAKGKRSSRVEGGESIAESKHSIFRFGKTIAASFNPTNWKIWNKDKGEDEEEKQLRILKERQEKAEKIYKELKDSGRFHDGAVGFRIYQDESEDQEMREIEEERGRRQSRDMSRGRPTTRASKMFDGARRRMSRDRSMSRAREISREDKRKGVVFLEPPKMSVSESPAPLSTTSNQSSPNKSSIFKKPSLRNIRNSFSNETSIDGEPHRARRIPSRKDLHKQQKLVKRVSDLEGKLEHARRQLNQSLGDPLAIIEDQPIRRPKFVPGALSSLPSERLLSGYVPDDEEGYTEDGIEEESEIGVAFSVDSNAVTRNSQMQTESQVSAEWARIGASKAPDAGLKEEALPIAAVEGLVPSVEKDDTVSEASNTKAFRRAMEMKGPDTVASTAPPSTVSSKFDDPEDSDYQEPEVKKTPLKTKNVKQKKPIVNNASMRHVSETGKVEPEAESASESDQELTPRPINSLLAFKDADSPTPKPAWNAGFGATTGSGGTKKRKSIFEREADDGGLYKPAKGEESESEVSSIPASKIKKTTNLASNRPRKLQKLEFTDSLAKKATPRQSENGTKKEYGGLKNLRSSPAAISQITLQVPKDFAGTMAKAQARKRDGGVKPSGNKLTKAPSQPSQQSQSHSSRRSESPSPSSAIRPSEIQAHDTAQASQTSNGNEHASLQYKKPNTPPPRKRNSKLERDEIFTAAPGDEAGIPPMPRFPSTIRLSSGEIVVTNPFKDLEGGGFADVGEVGGEEKKEVGRGLTKARAMPKSPSNRNLGRESGMIIDKIEEDFEWPEDVF